MLYLFCPPYTCRYSEVEELTENFASGINHFMLSEWGRMVAIFSKSRMEWFIADLACGLMGVATVKPIH